MEARLGGEPESDNRRHGHNRKRVLTDDGALDLEVPRDRAGRFEPQLVEKYARRLIRRSLAYVSYKERRPLAAALKTIYRAPTAAAAEAALVLSRPVRGVRSTRPS